MNYFLLTIYLLIGFQIGARTFFWGRSISRDTMDFVVHLIVVPLTWPFYLSCAFFVEGIWNSVFNFEGPRANINSLADQIERFQKLIADLESGNRHE